MSNKRQEILWNHKDLQIHMEINFNESFFMSLEYVTYIGQIHEKKIVEDCSYDYTETGYKKWKEIWGRNTETQLRFKTWREDIEREQGQAGAELSQAQHQLHIA